MSIASALATSLGINMRSADENARFRLWCSLFMLECSLTTITGRPSMPFSVQASLLLAKSSFSQSPASMFLGNDSEHEKIGRWSLFEDNAHTGMRAGWLKSMQPDQALFFHY